MSNCHLKCMFPMLREMLLLHEGIRLKAYRCSAGKLTIGVGHNIDDDPSWPRGRLEITEDEAYEILQADMEKAVQDCYALFKTYGSLSCSRKVALADMAFNLGRTRLGAFKKMIAAVDNDDMWTASEEALNSKWAKQVGPRSARIARMIEG